ncbi:hypothetical protein HUT08_23585 [Streptomyces buecherae]|uniref:Uncharacterized protein n=1 Tax=Streptomyces buecherae TaxID=2763006 RepID=A0A7H8NJI1_9ACTN|nr:hypothetical protein HUT08_23585 [Streptomyces buecherae]
MGDTPDLVFVAQLEERADELVRAAVALHLDGSRHEGRSAGLQEEILPGGMFQYMTVVRQERPYIVQVTAWPL